MDLRAGECIGYITRAINATERPGCWSLGAYVAQNVLILVAPAFMAASIYMILGRIILLTDGDSHSLIGRRWITKIFVTGDVISLLMQSSGMYMHIQYSVLDNSHQVQRLTH